MQFTTDHDQYYFATYESEVCSFPLIAANFKITFRNRKRETEFFNYNYETKILLMKLGARTLTPIATDVNLIR